MINIRKMELRDVPIVLQYGTGEKRFTIREESFWSVEQLNRWVDADKDVLLVAEERDKIVGYVTSQYHSPTKKAVIENLYVAESQRGNSIGTKLINEAVKQLRAQGAQYICALVESDNKAIIKTLEKVGFNKQKQFLWMDTN